MLRFPRYVDLIASRFWVALIAASLEPASVARFFIRRLMTKKARETSSRAFGIFKKWAASRGCVSYFGQHLNKIGDRLAVFDHVGRATCLVRELQSTIDTQNLEDRRKQVLWTDRSRLGHIDFFCRLANRLSHL